MIRKPLRLLVINIIAVYLSILLLSGAISYVGGYHTLIFAGIVVSLVNTFIRPVVNLLLLPIHLMTLGLSRWLVNLTTLFLLTLLVPQIIVHSFNFTGFNLAFIHIPPITFSLFMSYIFCSFIMSTVFHFMYWLFSD